MSRDQVPEGWEVVAKYRSGEIWRSADEIVVLGMPPHGDEDAHNCDAMGCGQDHVVYRAKWPAALTGPIDAMLRVVELEGQLATVEAERDAARAALAEALNGWAQCVYPGDVDIAARIADLRALVKP